MKSGSAPARPERPYSVSIERTELLPFRVRLVDGAKDLHKAVEIRSSAFNRHFPELGNALRDAEADDHRPDVLLLIAERKLDGRILGSMRLQPNTRQVLRVEEETALPERLQDRRLIEFMRLGIENGNAGRMVMAALGKAGYEIAHASRFEFILAAGRRSTSQIYRSMQFDDVFSGDTVALSYARGAQHSIFALPVRDADRRWRTADHSLYDFMARTQHPDVQIDFERVATAFEDV